MAIYYRIECKRSNGLWRAVGCGPIADKARALNLAQTLDDHGNTVRVMECGDGMPRVVNQTRLEG